MARGPLRPPLRLLVLGFGLALLRAAIGERAAALSRSDRAVTCEECGGGRRRRPLFPGHLLELRPGQVHGLRVVPGAAAQRLLPGLRYGPSGSLRAAVAHPGGHPESSPGARITVWLPGLETMPQEREIYHPHRGDRRGGLPRRGPDPMTVSAPCQPGLLLIHSFWSQPLPSRHSLCRAQPTTGRAGRRVGVNHLRGLRFWGAFQGV